MNPITSIISAIEIGAATNLNDSQKTEYSRFLELLRRQLAGSEDAFVALEALLGKPGSNARIAVLEEELFFIEKKNPKKIHELAALAIHFINLVEANQDIRRGKYNINTSEVQGIVAGDLNNVTQSF